uniref:Uncharacterized protein n=1 Tax=Chromera velia CCMP2878 TaxID=1169474 RepID=A0A0G4G8U1_9ALVE|eukprot:Cvel_20689.t1-p1 / transcript=Cvel_20689.t1 / gene=Cvel_20689 / organism=Chromera_velia_CCMP2878 / gene_product=hypothetical protein / transcript_product=hypothetical protein / location=Cvel_scaffold1881:36054-37268(+) / protein_length=98 / sequence_SO=supercontig / SO=protein_coding / is_pseudo=false
MLLSMYAFLRSAPKPAIAGTTPLQGGGASVASRAVKRVYIRFCRPGRDIPREVSNPADQVSRGTESNVEPRQTADGRYPGPLTLLLHSPVVDAECGGL